VATKQKGSNRTAIPDLSQFRGISNVDEFPALALWVAVVEFSRDLRVGGCFGI